MSHKITLCKIFDGIQKKIHKYKIILNLIMINYGLFVTQNNTLFIDV